MGQFFTESMFALLMFVNNLRHKKYLLNDKIFDFLNQNKFVSSLFGKVTNND